MSDRDETKCKYDPETDMPRATAWTEGLVAGLASMRARVTTLEGERDILRGQVERWSLDSADLRADRDRLAAELAEVRAVLAGDHVVRRLRGHLISISANGELRVTDRNRDSILRAIIGHLRALTATQPPAAHPAPGGAGGADALGTVLGAVESVARKAIETASKLRPAAAPPTVEPGRRRIDGRHSAACPRRFQGPDAYGAGPGACTCAPPTVEPPAHEAMRGRLQAMARNSERMAFNDRAAILWALDHVEACRGQCGPPTATPGEREAADEAHDLALPDCTATKHVGACRHATPGEPGEER